MRLFQLTINVYAPDRGLPVTFQDWIDLAFGTEGMDLGATPTTLEMVRELRYPLSDDIIERRGKRDAFLY